MVVSASTPHGPGIENFFPTEIFLSLVFESPEVRTRDRQFPVEDFFLLAATAWCEERSIHLEDADRQWWTRKGNILK